MVEWLRRINLYHSNPHIKQRLEMDIICTLLSNTLYAFQSHLILLLRASPLSTMVHKIVKIHLNTEKACRHAYLIGRKKPWRHAYSGRQTHWLTSFKVACYWKNTSSLTRRYKKIKAKGFVCAFGNEYMSVCFKKHTQKTT